MSSSSAVASTNWSSTPGIAIRNVAVSSALSASAAAASVTSRHVLQFAELKVRAVPLCTERLALPAERDTLTTTGVTGFWFSRT